MHHAVEQPVQGLHFFPPGPWEQAAQAAESRFQALFGGPPQEIPKSHPRPLLFTPRLSPLQQLAVDGNLAVGNQFPSMMLDDPFA